MANPIYSLRGLAWLLIVVAMITLPMSGRIALDISQAVHILDHTVVNVFHLGAR